MAQLLLEECCDILHELLTIAFNGMDDGSRVTIFNSQYPGGLVIPGSYVYLGGTDSCNPATGCFSENQCPDCSGAMPAIANIWPPNHKFVPVGVVGISDPQGQTATIRIDGIAQDEPTNTYGDRDFCPDGAGIGASQALVRAERSGTRKVPGDGRVYHISFTATDPDGYSCSGTVSTCVPHDQGGRSACIDQGALYNSLMCVP